jgi:uncharacterized membrane protein YphA (DoxX/SURF4 family)
MMMAWISWIEILLRWILGLQFAFWGLNGFFRWLPIPPSSDFINRFSDLCYESGFILPTVKIFEIVFGLLLLSGSRTLIALIMLGPIVFVISGLHLFHNSRKSWQVLGPISIPYLLLVVLDWALFKNLLLY